MQKFTLNKLNIFTPLSNNKLMQNEDFDIDNFLHFPVLINNDGNVWKHGSLYLLSKLKKYQNDTMYTANIPLTPPYWKQTNDLALVQIDE